MRSFFILLILGFGSWDPLAEKIFSLKHEKLRSVHSSTQFLESPYQQPPWLLLASPTEIQRVLSTYSKPKQPPQSRHVAAAQTANYQLLKAFFHFNEVIIHFADSRIWLARDSGLSREACWTGCRDFFITLLHSGWFSYLMIFQKYKDIYLSTLCCTASAADSDGLYWAKLARLVGW